MPIRLRENPYQGVNAHLNSYLQNEPGGWESFHAEHIIDIARIVNANLPAGYYTRPEKSLQISEFDPLAQIERISRTRPHVTIYDLSSTSASSALMGGATPTITIPIAATLVDEDFLTGIVIYSVGQGTEPGKPVTRIELLSPANKPGGSHHRQYVAKRQETLKSNLRLVEIDYLYETRPAIPNSPSYPDSAPGAFPYTIFLSDPRPSLTEGQTQGYGFVVDSPIPILKLPLSGNDAVTVDFGAAYLQTFNDSTFYPIAVDYEQKPMRFETYSPDDQRRIESRMAAIAASHPGSA